jgi:Ca-activated chloride channel family protein
MIYTIAVGDPAASDENRVDLATLQAVASATKGQFFRAEDGAQLQAIYTEIDRLAPVKLQTLSWRPRLPLFQWPLGAAVILSLALWLGLLAASERGRRRLSAHV